MRMRKVFNILFLLVLVTIGVWLIGRPGALTPEGVARRQALLGALAPEGSDRGLQRTPNAASSATTYDPVTPVVVDFSTIVDTFDERDSLYERWLRGEVDLDREATLITEAEMDAMRALALQQPPDNDVQIVPDGPQPAAPQPGIAFDSIAFSLANGGSVPPDPELAVGPNHLIAVVNVAVAIYDKSGNVLLGPTNAGNLFPGLSQCAGGNLYDPNVLYDEESDRWIIAYDTLAFDSAGGYCLAASQTANPVGSWNAYFFHLNSAASWLDFPHAGVGDNFIIMGGNMFSGSGSFVESRLFAFNKSNLYNGLATSVVAKGLGGGRFTPQPLNLHGFRSGTWPGYGNEHYVLVEDVTPYIGRYHNLVRWNPATSALTTIGTIDYGSTSWPVDVPQSGSGAKITANDWRPLDFEYRNGYGWTTMTVSCNPGSGVVNCVRWAQINLANASLGPAGSGTYASNGAYRFFPDLAVNRCNDMAVGYTKSSSATYPGIWVTGREHSDPSGTLQGEIQLKAGEKSYSSFAADPPPHRWGDYTGMTIDPDGERFWYLGEYSKNITASANWGTYVGSFAFPDCTTAAPSSRALILSLVVKTGAPPATGPTPGLWSGDGVAMQFYVSADRHFVEQFAVWINVPTCNIYNYKVTHTTAEPISNNTFSFGGPFSASGTFHTTTTASGQLDLDSYYIPGCGNVGFADPVSWSASWSSQQTPTSPSAGDGPTMPNDQARAVTVTEVEP